MKLKSESDNCAVYHSRDYGPTFGLGHDISLGENSFTHIGYSYECPTDQTDNCFLTGDYNFQLKEVEIFSVKGKKLRERGAADTESCCL
eukprot:6360118-Ditylum_brightwellii.AAC.1